MLTAERQPTSAPHGYSTQFLWRVIKEHHPKHLIYLIPKQQEFDKPAPKTFWS